MIPSDSLVSVAVPRPMRHSFTYRIPEQWVSQVRVGSWVRVPFGASETMGVIVEHPKDISQLPPGLSEDALKSVLELGPLNEVMPQDVMILCQWARGSQCRYPHP
jgi:primosomal protein N' (replication factor Y)